MKTIRKNVFETNSSSSHSLVIEDTGKNVTLYTDNENNIIIDGEYEFGWGIEKIYDINAKIAYFYLDNHHNKEAISLLKEIILEKTGANDLIIKITTDWNNPNYSYIDHLSHGTSRGLTKTELENFIFNPNSYIQLDHDNH